MPRAKSYSENKKKRDIFPEVCSYPTTCKTLRMLLTAFTTKPTGRLLLFFAVFLFRFVSVAVDCVFIPFPLFYCCVILLLLYLYCCFCCCHLSFLLLSLFLLGLLFLLMIMFCCYHYYHCPKKRLNC